MGKQPLYYICATSNQAYNIITDINAEFYDCIRDKKFLSYAIPWEDTNSKEDDRFWLPVEQLRIVDSLQLASSKVLDIDSKVKSLAASTGKIKTPEDYSKARQAYEDKQNELMGGK